jgi:hypothetical protein
VSGLGLLVFVFALGMPAGNPPSTVLGMIIAVITALSVMQAAGGLDYLLEIAENVLRRNPARITILAPIVTYALIFVSGTQHVIYALLPIIAEVSRKAGIRPERPLSISVIASQQGLTASPISAVTVALIGALSGSAVGLPQILLVTIPATLVGVTAGISSCPGAAPSSPTTRNTAGASPRAGSPSWTQPRDSQVLPGATRSAHARRSSPPLRSSYCSGWSPTCVPTSRWAARS